MPTIDIDAVRARFPALSELHDTPTGRRPLTFFDGPGGTQVPDTVIDAVTGYYRRANANHGGPFATSRGSDAMVAEAHAAVADLLGVTADEIVLGANMTTLTFHLSRGITASFAAGDEIVVTGLDHQANVDPWLLAARDRDLVVRTWEPRLADCTLHVEDLEPLLGPRTRLVAFGWASNAVGTINPVAEAAAAAHRVGALAWVDAVHAAPHLPLDARAVDADFVACSVYKFFGPHVGAVYGRQPLHASLPAYRLRPADPPLETGTGNFEGYAGTLAAVEYLAWLGTTWGAAPAGASRRERIVAGMTALRRVEMALYRPLADGLAEIPGLRIVGLVDPAADDRRTPTAAITLAGRSPREVAARLADGGIAVWDGDFYATGLIERLGLVESGGVVRIGLTHYNTAAEVERLLGALERIAAG
jgi:cysteine desulfurase family protein (TIGR01976 family)